MNAQEANEERKKGNFVIEEPGKGFRRVVSAPNPVKIVELDAVKALLDANQVVIAAGGGGIPVLEQDNHLRGASAVIEKDLAAGKLAEGIDAEMLIILTNVEKVCINLGQKDEEPLGEITTEQAKTYMEEGHFGIYNMLPKFRASVDFVEECEGRSIIGNGVRISAGAKVLGQIKIDDNAIIAANAVVVKDVERNAIVGGVPARIIGTNVNHILYME